MAGPTDLEQLLLEYLNDARMDPLGDAVRYIKAYDTIATSSDSMINAALLYYKVSGPALLGALQALKPVQPLAWNEALSTSADVHDLAMIAADAQAHQLPGEASVAARTIAAGYGSSVGENIYAYSYTPLFAQAGFMVDWGPGTNGMQDDAGHRINIMYSTYREVGIGIQLESDNATKVGPQVVTEDFGRRYADHDPLLLGVAYNDADHDDFYSAGEGLGTLNVAIGAASVTSYASGGYTLASALRGTQDITFTGAGLSAPVVVTANLAADGNYKMDVVNGTELKTSVSAVVSGPITTLEVLGVAGLSLTATGSGAHTLTGGSGDDVLTGGSGGNVIHGGAGNDVVTGGIGNDHLYGDAGDDTLTGGAGDDILEGGTGNDTLIGGDGHDTAVLNMHFADALISYDVGKVTIKNRVTGDVTTISSVETYQFDDYTALPSSDGRALMVNLLHPASAAAAVPVVSDQHSTYVMYDPHQAPASTLDWHFI